MAFEPFINADSSIQGVDLFASMKDIIYCLDSRKGGNLKLAFCPASHSRTGIAFR